MRFTNTFISRSAIHLLVGLVISSGLITSAWAQTTYVYQPRNNNPATWSRQQEWTNAAAPVSGTTIGLVFSNSQGAGSSNDLTGLTVNSWLFVSQATVANVVIGNAITLSGGITNNSTSLQTINLNIATTAARTITAASGNIALGGIISGTNGGITKDGANTLTLSGVNTYTGATTLSAGTLRATTSASALGAGTLSLGGGNLELANDTGLNFGRNTTVTGNTTIFSERLTAGAGVTHTLGTLSIGAQTLTVGTDATVNSGTAGLTFGATTLSASGSVFSVNTGTLLTLASVTGAGNSFTATGAGNTTVTGAITTGAGGVTKTGTGTLLLSAANTYTGTTTIGAGVLAVTNGAAIADTAAVTLSNTAGATLLLSGSETIGSLRGGGASGGNVSIASGSTLTVAETGSQTYSGAITNAGSFTKSGAGTTTLSGANTFSGALAVQGGVLNLAAATGQAAGSAASLSVSTGATLLISQSNQVNDAAAVTLSGGTITRGGNVGEVFGNLNLTTASFLDYGAANAAGTIRFGTYAPSSLLTVQNFLPGNKLQFGNTISLGDLNNTSLFQFSNGFTTSTEDGFFTITAIPEPSTYAAAAGLIGLMLWPSRRRIIRDAKKILGFHPPMRDRLAARRTN